MGALPQDRGVSFRVWAPHATRGARGGDLQPLAEGRHSAADESNGYWFGHAPKAAPGDEYRFSLTTPSGTLSRSTPIARQVTNSVGNGVIYDHAVFDWDDDEVVAPAHHELVIYELHIGILLRTERRAGRHPRAW